MTIWERVKAALAGITVPVVANHYTAASGTAQPALYLVYFLVSAPPLEHADNVEISRVYRVQISTYSRSGLVGLPDVDTPMLAAGFTRGPMNELPYNKETGHFGLAKEYLYLEEE